jgi:lysyl-tRNA synthetase class 2
VRARIRAALRGFFEGQGFTEVEPAALQLSPGNEAHIGGFATDFVTPDGLRQRYFLHSSPEFACKKLLAAGEEKIYALTPVWRNGERGPLHHPEFTMLEWYRAHTSYSALMEDCRAILERAAKTAGVSAFSYRGMTCDPFAEPERLTLCEAFARFAEIDLAACLDDREKPSGLAFVSLKMIIGLICFPRFCRIALSRIWDKVARLCLIFIPCQKPHLRVHRHKIPALLNALSFMLAVLSLPMLLVN